MNIYKRWVWTETPYKHGVFSNREDEIQSSEAEERNRPWPRYTTTLRENRDSGNVDKQLDYVFRCRYLQFFWAHSKRIPHWSVAVQIHQGDVTIYIVNVYSPVHRESTADVEPVKECNASNQTRLYTSFSHLYVKYKVLIHGSACRRTFGYMLVITSKYKNDFFCLASSFIFLDLHVNNALYSPYTVNIKNHNHLYCQVLWVYMCKELVLVYCKKKIINYKNNKLNIWR